MKYYTRTLPRFWWINPWTHVKHMHKALVAMQEYIQAQETCIDDIEEMQSKQIDELALERDRAIILANKYRYKFESRFDYLNDVYNYENKNK